MCAVYVELDTCKCVCAPYCARFYALSAGLVQQIARTHCEENSILGSNLSTPSSLFLQNNTFTGFSKATIGPQLTASEQISSFFKIIVKSSSIGDELGHGNRVFLHTTSFHDFRKMSSNYAKCSSQQQTSTLRFLAKFNFSTPTVI